MRTHFVVVVLAIVLMAGVVAPASAGGGGLLAGVSWPFYSERPVEIHAGLSQHLKLMEDPDRGRPDAVPAIDPAIIPMDRRYHLLDDIRHMRVDLLSMGIDPERIKQTQMDLWREDGGAAFDGYALFVDLHALTPDEKIITAEVRHNSSRREGEWNFLFFSIKTVKHVMTTDRVVTRFILVDVSDWIDWAVPRLFGEGVSPMNLAEDQRNLLRAAIFEDQCRDTLQFMKPLPRYGFMSQLEHLRLQGAPAPFQPLESTPYQQALAEVAALRAQLEADIEALRTAEAERLAKIEAERKAAEAEAARIAAEAEANRKAAEEAANWLTELREVYQDSCGYVFVAVGADGKPCGNPLTLTFFQKLKDCSWKRNTNNPMTSEDGVIDFLYKDPSMFADWGWIGFGVSTNSAEPAKMYGFNNNELHIIAVKQTADGGVEYVSH